MWNSVECAVMLIAQFWSGGVARGKHFVPVVELLFCVLKTYHAYFLRFMLDWPLLPLEGIESSVPINCE